MSEKGRAVTLEEARGARGKAMAMFEGRPGVLGVGIARTAEGYAVKVNLAARGDAAIPDEIDGVPVRVEILGAIRKRSRPGSRRSTS